MEVCENISNEKHENASPKCNPFAVRHDKLIGRYLVASRNIEPGETILVDSPLAVGPNPGGTLQCITCGFGGWTSYSCEKCGFTFCSYDCKSTDEHKNLCDNIATAYKNICLKQSGTTETSTELQQSILPATIINDIILPIRLLLLRRTDLHKNDQYLRLMGHDEEKEKDPEYWNRIHNILSPLILGSLESDFSCTDQDCTDSLQLEDVVRAFNIMNTNCIGISGRYTCVNTRLGAIRGVYPTLSLHSHSCITNCRYIIRKQPPYTAEIRSKVYIKEGEVLSIPYISPHYRTEERQKRLNDGWNFICTCSRCLDPTELGAMTSAVRCFMCCKEEQDKNNNESYPGVLLPDSPINKTSCSWSCHCVQYQDSSSNQENGDSFSILPNSSQHKVEYKAVKEVIDKFKRLVSQTDRTDIKANLKLLDLAYKELHPNHQFLIDIRGRLIPNMCNTSDTCISLMDYETIKTKQKLCEEQLQVMNIIDPGLSVARGKLLVELQQTKLKIAKKELAEGIISEKQFSQQNVSCKELIKEASLCLRDEPIGTMEKVYETMAESALKEYH